MVLLISIISQIGNAQEYKKIDYSKLKYTRNSGLSEKAITITKKDNSKLSEGFYEMTIKNNPDQFYISSKGNVDGIFKEYYSNNLFCVTILKEGKLENMVYLDSIGKTIDSIQIRNKDIEIYSNVLKKWETKNLLVYARYNFNDNEKFI